MNVSLVQAVAPAGDEQIGVAIAGGQKTTLSQSGIGQSQRAKSFAVEFLVYVESILPVGIEVGVARRRQMRHTGVIDMLAFCLQLSRLRA
jgi:hypothetical protein